MKDNILAQVNDGLLNEVICEMYEYAFKRKVNNIGIKKLSGGLKNKVYLIDDGKRKIVLKVEPSNIDAMSDIDRNVLWWEAEMLKYIEKLNIPSPKLLFYSDKTNFCTSPFLFMTYIEGNSYLSCKDNLSKEQKQRIEYEIGQISYKVSSIKKKKYFLPSYPNKIFKTNFDFIKFLFSLLLKVYDECNINVDGISKDKIDQLLKEKKDYLNKINKICLSNTDLWDGNILIKNGEITGIVDFTDIFYCDELMNFYFHPTDSDTSEYFLLGYNNKKLTTDEIIRIEIYRFYNLLKMIVDCEIKKYGRFSSIYEKFVKQYNLIKSL